MASPQAARTFGHTLFLAAMLAAPAFATASGEGSAKLAAAEAHLLAGRPINRQGVEGVATYYAKRFNGRKTASGETYPPDRLTAAHPELPLGTRVKVVNLSNGREVVVTVNDRCRRKRGAHIDLSRGAARELGFLGVGKTRVRIVTLNGEVPREPAAAD